MGGMLLQIEKCKLNIREAVKQCEASGGDRQILARHFDEDGEIDQKWIFCAKCKDQESYEVSSSCSLSLRILHRHKIPGWTVHGVSFYWTREDSVLALRLLDDVPGE